MAQPVIDLMVGYVKRDIELKKLDIPHDICKICATYVDIDVIEVTKDYPSCDYNIPIVFKARETNETTLYFGCESYQVLEDNNKIIFHLPYCYINKAKEWFRVHGGGGNKNGILAAKHLSFIMKLTYLSVNRDCGKFFNDEATNTLREMYYSAYSRASTPEIPILQLDYHGRGKHCNDMKLFTAKSHSDVLIVYDPLK